MILDFGKHKGKSIDDVPISYIIFLAGYRLVGTKKYRSNLSACKWIKEVKPAVHAYATSFLLNKCWNCGGQLVPVGHSRMNGASHDDWEGRHLHKKCWRELKTQEEEEEAACECDSSD